MLNFEVAVFKDSILTIGHSGAMSYTYLFAIEHHV